MEVANPMTSDSVADVRSGAATKFADLTRSATVKQGADPQTSAALSEIDRPSSDIHREGGNQVNRFLLCALVSQSAKQIKARAATVGEALPITMIVRGILRSYRQAAIDDYGPLAKPELDIPGLKKLNDKVLRDEIKRLSRERVTDSQTRLANAERLGDVMRIQSEKVDLERALELLKRLNAKPAYAR
jgi:hypothetical protein